MNRQKVVAIVGMAGSGKGLFSSIARARKIPVFICGDVIREETERRGLSPTPENIAAVMLSIRDKEGSAVVAERLIPKLESCRTRIVVVEGVRSIAEIEALKRRHKVTITAVHASPRTRYERLLKRARSDDPKSWDEFVERDSRELGVGIGNVIAVAEQMLVNEATVNEFNAVAETTISRVMRE